MKNKAAISRADLLRALIAAGPGGSVPVGLLGYERRSLGEHSSSLKPPGDPSGSKTVVTEDVKPRPEIEYPKPQRGQRAIKFLLPVEHEVLQDPPRPSEPQVAALSDEDLAVPGHAPAPILPLVPWSRLAPFLRRRLGVVLPGRRLDQKCLSRMVASGLPLVSLPRLARQNWGHGACVLWDTSPEMEPYLPDAEQILQRLKRERGRHGLKVFECYGPQPQIPLLPPQAPVLLLSAMGQLHRDAALREAWARIGFSLARAGHRLTALTPSPRRRWLGTPAAVWPCAVWDRRPHLPRHLRTVAISPAADREEPSAPPASAEAELLLDLLWPAALITPGLLREVRILIGARADAGTEHEAWFHPHSTGVDSIRYFSLRHGPDYDARAPRRRALAQAPETRELVRQANAVIERHHQRVCCSVIAAEAWWLARLTDTGPGTRVADPRQILERAVERLRVLADAPGSSAGLSSGLGSWFHDFVECRLTEEMRKDPAVARLVAQGWILARKFLDRLGSPWPSGLDSGAALEELRRHGKRHGRTPPKGYLIGVAGANLIAVPEGAVLPRGLLAQARINAVLPLLHLRSEHTSASVPVVLDASCGVPLPGMEQPLPLTVESDCERLRIEARERPVWAKRMWYECDGIKAMASFCGGDYSFVWSLGGERSRRAVAGGPARQSGEWTAITRPAWTTRLWADELGLAAEFKIGGAVFVLRWIPPGRFLMGSPENEPGRFSDEGPRHAVTISRGFWMGETPVTQAQWRAVVEAARSNAAWWKKFSKKEALQPDPNHFKGPGELPVEQVSWEDGAAFCRLLDGALPDGPGFRLPSEAQWEYACRAGSDTALCAGGITIKGENHAPELDPIAWYGGNSGLELEVSNPSESTSWVNKQYDHKQAGTHRVKLKAPNPWGLYDTIGNVWEWCLDGMRTYTDEEQRDPAGPMEKSANRVARGGSWSSNARYCRAAYRIQFDPGYRDNYLGLRMAAGQEPEVAEPLDAERPRAAEGRSRGRKPSA